MSLVVVLPFVVGAGFVLWYWARAVVRGHWRHSIGWFAGTTVMLVLGTGFTFLAGAFSGGLDPEEACLAAGQPYDSTYRHENFDEYTRWFPLHNRCHATYDLVPAWVNPTLVVLAILTACCVAYTIWLSVLRLTSMRGGC